MKECQQNSQTLVGAWLPWHGPRHGFRSRSCERPTIKTPRRCFGRGFISVIVTNKVRYHVLLRRWVLTVIGLRRFSARRDRSAERRKIDTTDPTYLNAADTAFAW